MTGDDLLQETLFNSAVQAAVGFSIVLTHTEVRVRSTTPSPNPFSFKDLSSGSTYLLRRTGFSFSKEYAKEGRCLVQCL
jgi:hypothetical protein